MGKIKEIHIELDGAYPAVVTAKTVNITAGSAILLTANDLEQLQAMMRYIRETASIQVQDSKLSGEYPTVGGFLEETAPVGRVRK